MTIKQALDCIKEYQPLTKNNQKTYNGVRKVNIYLDYINGMKKIDVARKYGLSSSRIDQIIRYCDRKINYLIKW